ncbi:MAG: alpha/beta fold hydrolase, partial [Pseudomonadota bacterium]
EAPPRPETMEFQRLTISIPATHEPGQIEWPSGEPDARTDFVAVENQRFSDGREFVDAIIRSDDSGTEEVLLFVHGYNTRHAEAVYMIAQFANDFNVTTPSVLFSWPSAGVTAGYVYDRDSALISRDLLERAIIELTRKPGRRIMLLGHSMGSHLIMETLRQIELKGSLDIASKINGLVLMAPDIDGELFRYQVGTIEELPDPFVIMVAEQDGALKISSLLTGLRPRLGSQTDRSVVGDLPISVVDVSDLATGKNFDHKIVTTSPAAIAILNKLSEETPPGEATVGELVVLTDFAN